MSSFQNASIEPSNPALGLSGVQNIVRFYYDKKGGQNSKGPSRAVGERNFFVRLEPVTTKCRYGSKVTDDSCSLKSHSRTVEQSRLMCKSSTQVYSLNATLLHKCNSIFENKMFVNEA